LSISVKRDAVLHNSFPSNEKKNNFLLSFEQYTENYWSLSNCK
jgi:hypothetical protein